MGGGVSIETAGHSHGWALKSISWRSVDIIGRKWAFNLSLLVTSLFGLLLGVPSSYGAICALAALCGLGLVSAVASKDAPQFS